MKKNKYIISLKNYILYARLKYVIKQKDYTVKCKS